MGVHRCKKCGCDPGPFFIWSSSRDFDREKFIKSLDKKNMSTKSEIKSGVKICYACYQKVIFTARIIRI